MYTGESLMLINYSSTFLTVFPSFIIQVQNQPKTYKTVVWQLPH